MSALAPTPAWQGLQLQGMTEAWLEPVALLERQAYTHPWSHGNFSDSLRAGYHAWVLVEGQELIGYLVIMLSPGEAHLLNITIAPPRQGQGLGLHLLQQGVTWARLQGAQTLWLEVRVSNARARSIYERYGFKTTGLRRNYYPLAAFKREDAIVMSLPLQTGQSL